jgi:uncharacterized protein with von Willebrand factor type A (vWA) domain
MNEPISQFNSYYIHSRSGKEIIERVVATPRNIPRHIREDLASIIIKELIDGKSIQIKDSQKFIQYYGVFYPLLIHLRHSELWQSIKELATESPEVAAPVTEFLLTKIFDLIDLFPKIRDGIYDDLDKEMQDLLEQFEELLEDTNDQWNRNIPNTPLSWNDEISRVFTEFSEILAQITPDQILDPDTTGKICDDCSDAIKTLEESLENPENTESWLNSDKMKELIDELKKAINEIKNEKNIEVSDGSDNLESNDETESEDLIENGDSGLSGKTGEGNENSQTDEPGQGDGTQQGEGSRGGEVSRQEDGNRQGQGTNDGEGESIIKGDGTQKENSTGKISNLVRQMLNQLQKLKKRTAGSSNDSKSGIAEKIADFSNNKNAGNLIQSILEKSTFDPINAMLQLFKPHIDTMNFLAQLFPSKGWGSEITALKKEYIANLEKYAKIVEKNDELKDILKLIGRIELEYGIKKQSISPMGRSEVHSITLSNDISRLLPTEAVKFHHPLLRKKLYADFTEGKLLTYNLRGKNWTDGPPKKKEQGPVVALVDTSGSMQGTPEIVAKSVVLALAKKMLKQERDVKVILFSGPKSTVEIELTSKKKMAKEFLKFLEGSFGGGTDFNTALKSGLESLKQPAFKGADLLFITDGDSEISDISAINTWKKIKEEQKARVFTLIIDNNSSGGLSPISDYTYFIQKDRHWSLNNSPATMIRFIASPNNPSDRRSLRIPKRSSER